MKTFVEQPLVESSARSSSGTSNSRNVSRSEFVSLTFVVTAISGTNAKVGFQIDFSHDGTNWWNAKDIVRTDSTGALTTRVPTFAKFIRVQWSIVGTSPQVTFYVDLSFREE